MIKLWILIDRNINMKYFFFVDLTLEKPSTIDPGFIIFELWLYYSDISIA
jgi:hypothetical protein